MSLEHLKTFGFYHLYLSMDIIYLMWHCRHSFLYFSSHTSFCAVSIFRMATLTSFSVRPNIRSLSQAVSVVWFFPWCMSHTFLFLFRPQHFFCCCWKLGILDNSLCNSRFWSLPPTLGLVIVICLFICRAIARIIWVKSIPRRGVKPLMLLLRVAQLWVWPRQPGVTVGRVGLSSSLSLTTDSW